MYLLVLIVAAVLIVEAIAYKLRSTSIDAFYKKWLADHKEWLDENEAQVNGYIKRLRNFGQWFHDLCAKPVD